MDNLRGKPNAEGNNFILVNNTVVKLATDKQLHNFLYPPLPLSDVLRLFLYWTNGSFLCFSAQMDDNLSISMKPALKRG